MHGCFSTARPHTDSLYASIPEGIACSDRLSSCTISSCIVVSAFLRSIEGGRKREREFRGNDFSPWCHEYHLARLANELKFHVLTSAHNYMLKYLHTINTRVGERARCFTYAPLHIRKRSAGQIIAATLFLARFASPPCGLG